MRQALGLLSLIVAFGTLAGCFSTDPPRPQTAAQVGAPSGDKDHTLEYWDKVREVMRLRSNANEMRQLAEVIRKQADTVRSLPVDFVDMDLVIAACAVAQSQEKRNNIAEKANYNPASLRGDVELKNAYVSAGEQVNAAMASLKALAPKLSARYGVTFLPIDDPK